eukprot:ANDGO_04430.mRNA.1 hypothetical protein
MRETASVESVISFKAQAALLQSLFSSTAVATDADVVSLRQVLQPSKSLFSLLASLIPISPVASQTPSMSVILSFVILATVQLDASRADQSLDSFLSFVPASTAIAAIRSISPILTSFLTQSSEQNATHKLLLVMLMDFVKASHLLLGSDHQVAAVLMDRLRTASELIAKSTSRFAALRSKSILSLPRGGFASLSNAVALSLASATLKKGGIHGDVHVVCSILLEWMSKYRVPFAVMENVLLRCNLFVQCVSAWSLQTYAPSFALECAHSALLISGKPVSADQIALGLISGCIPVVLEASEGQKQAMPSWLEWTDDRAALVLDRSVALFMENPAPQGLESVAASIRNAFALEDSSVDRQLRVLFALIHHALPAMKSMNTLSWEDDADEKRFLLIVSRLLMHPVWKVAASFHPEMVSTRISNLPVVLRPLFDGASPVLHESVKAVDGKTVEWLLGLSSAALVVSSNPKILMSAIASRDTTTDTLLSVYHKLFVSFPMVPFMLASAHSKIRKMLKTLTVPDALSVARKVWTTGIAVAHPGSFCQAVWTHACAYGETLAQTMPILFRYLPSYVVSMMDHLVAHDPLWSPASSGSQKDDDRRRNASLFVACLVQQRPDVTLHQVWRSDAAKQVPLITACIRMLAHLEHVETLNRVQAYADHRAQIVSSSVGKLSLSSAFSSRKSRTVDVDDDSGAGAQAEDDDQDQDDDGQDEENENAEVDAEAEAIVEEGNEAAKDAEMAGNGEEGGDGDTKNTETENGIAEESAEAVTAAAAAGAANAGPRENVDSTTAENILVQQWTKGVGFRILSEWIFSYRAHITSLLDRGGSSLAHSVCLKIDELRSGIHVLVDFLTFYMTVEEWVRFGPFLLTSIAPIYALNENASTMESIREAFSSAMTEKAFGAISPSLDSQLVAKHQVAIVQSSESASTVSLNGLNALANSLVLVICAAMEQVRLSGRLEDKNADLVASWTSTEIADADAEVLGVDASLAEIIRVFWRFKTSDVVLSDGATSHSFLAGMGKTVAMDTIRIRTRYSMLGSFFSVHNGMVLKPQFYGRHILLRALFSVADAVFSARFLLAGWRESSWEKSSLLRVLRNMIEPVAHYVVGAGIQVAVPDEARALSWFAGEFVRGIFGGRWETQAFLCAFGRDDWQDMASQSHDDVFALLEEEEEQLSENASPHCGVSNFLLGVLAVSRIAAVLVPFLHSSAGWPRVRAATHVLAGLAEAVRDVQTTIHRDRTKPLASGVLKSSSALPPNIVWVHCGSVFGELNAAVRHCCHDASKGAYSRDIQLAAERCLQLLGVSLETPKSHQFDQPVHSSSISSTRASATGAAPAPSCSRSRSHSCSCSRSCCFCGWFGCGKAIYT